jgi:hypothetical protein
MGDNRPGGPTDRGVMHLVPVFALIASGSTRGDSHSPGRKVQLPARLILYGVGKGWESGPLAICGLITGPRLLRLVRDAQIFHDLAVVITRPVGVAHHAEADLDGGDIVGPGDQFNLDVGAVLGRG